jgi:hypothetical protein
VVVEEEEEEEGEEEEEEDKEEVGRVLVLNNPPALLMSSMRCLYMTSLLYCVNHSTYPMPFSSRMRVHSSTSFVRSPSL